MNNINRVQARPYVLDPLGLSYSKGYMFPKDANRVNNNNLKFTSNKKAELITNKQIKAKTAKYKNLVNQLQPQNINGNQLNTLI